jgi:AraC family transcriptional regulator
MEHWNEALRRIEDNLDREIDVAALARIAQTSEYHFRRMFSTLSGLPLSEYVRRRRSPSSTATGQRTRSRAPSRPCTG